MDNFKEYNLSAMGLLSLPPNFAYNDVDHRLRENPHINAIADYVANTAEKKSFVISV